MSVLRLPNAAIYAQAIFSPGKLNPDLYAPSKYCGTDNEPVIDPTPCSGVSHVDWKALKRRGFNAVVIDKDNCLVRGPIRHRLICYYKLILLVNSRHTHTSTLFILRLSMVGRS
jgi:hypothetical protein